jgi:hypothetical protein
MCCCTRPPPQSFQVIDFLFGATHMSGLENSLLFEDSQLSRRVKLFLASQPRPSLRYLQVQASGSTVTLRGLVTTYYERQLALQASRQIAGVRQLIDEITVQHIEPAIVPQVRIVDSRLTASAEQLAAV